MISKYKLLLRDLFYRSNKKI